MRKNNHNIPKISLFFSYPFRPLCLNNIYFGQLYNKNKDIFQYILHFISENTQFVMLSNGLMLKGSYKIRCDDERACNTGCDHDECQ